jgi:hypothetical protein
MAVDEGLGEEDCVAVLEPAAAAEGGGEVAVGGVLKCNG